MPGVTDEHFHLFGRITHFYASAEAGLKLCLCGMMDLPMTDVFVLTDRMGADTLRKVAKTIGKQRLDEALSQRFTHLIGELQAHARLRNYIGHHRWTNGTREGSIRPAYASGESGKLELYGYKDDDPDFAIEDFVKAANALLILNQRVVDFMTSTPIDARVREANMRDVPPISALPKTGEA